MENPSPSPSPTPRWQPAYPAPVGSSPSAAPGARRRALGEAGRWIVAGSALVALGSRIEVPMIPVPMTLQTYALVVVGALAGARLGAAALLLYLAEGAAGLPVFAGGAAGWHHFAGPTAGYLFAYPGAAALVGWLSAPRRPGGRPSWVRALLAANAGHALLFLGGVPWLALTLGWAKAVAVGLTPFLLSGLLQTVLAAGTVRALWPWARPQAR